MCTDGVVLSKHGYEKMTPKKAHVLVLEIFHKVHCKATDAKTLKNKPIGGDI